MALASLWWGGPPLQHVPDIKNRAVSRGGPAHFFKLATRRSQKDPWLSVAGSHQFWLYGRIRRTFNICVARRSSSLQRIHIRFVPRNLRAVILKVLRNRLKADRLSIYPLQDSFLNTYPYRRDSRASTHHDPIENPYLFGI